MKKAHKHTHQHTRFSKKTMSMIHKVNKWRFYVYYILKVSLKHIFSVTYVCVYDVKTNILIYPTIRASSDTQG